MWCLPPETMMISTWLLFYPDDFYVAVFERSRCQGGIVVGGKHLTDLHTLDEAIPYIRLVIADEVTRP
jgi:hypothetical protein